MLCVLLLAALASMSKQDMSHAHSSLHIRLFENKQTANSKQQTNKATNRMVVNGPTKELSSIENMMNAKDDEEDVAAVVVATEEEEVESASQYTERALEEFHKHSKLVRHAVPHISDSIQEGIKLGEGGFAIVCAVDYDGQACAKKKLKDCIITGETTKFKIAAADLWKEADFLSSFQHDHIVSLKATHLSFEDDMKDNFIVIDRLEKTLDQKIQEWNTKDQSFLLNKPQMRLKLLHERIQVAMDICHTFQYLHDQNVIYRDLKAGNLGFDQDGKIKLFGEYSCFRLMRLFVRLLLDA